VSSRITLENRLKDFVLLHLENDTRCFCDDFKWL